MKIVEMLALWGLWGLRRLEFVDTKYWGYFSKENQQMCYLRCTTLTTIILTIELIYIIQ